MEFVGKFEEILNKYKECTKKIRDIDNLDKGIDINKYIVRRGMIDTEIANCEQAIRKAGELYGESARKQYEETANEYISRIGNLENEKRTLSDTIHSMETRQKEKDKKEMQKKILKKEMNQLRAELIENIDSNTKKPEIIANLKLTLDRRQGEVDKYRSILKSIEADKESKKAGNPEYELFCRRKINEYRDLESDYNKLNEQWKKENIKRIDAIFMQSKIAMKEIDSGNYNVGLESFKSKALAPTTPVPTTPVPTTPVPTTPVPTTPVPTTLTGKEPVRIEVGRKGVNVIMDLGKRMPKFEVEPSDLEKYFSDFDGNIFSASKKIDTILSILGENGKNWIYQMTGARIREEDIADNLYKLDNSLIGALDCIKNKANSELNTVIDEEDKLYAQNTITAVELTMGNYLNSISTNKKTPGIGIKYDLNDLSKGNVRAVLSKIPILKNIPPIKATIQKVLPKDQRNYLSDIALKSTSFAEVSGTYYNHSKGLRKLFKDYGRKALPEPKSEKDSFMTRLQGYRMKEDPDKHKTQEEIKAMNRTEKNKIVERNRMNSGIDR